MWQVIRSVSELWNQNVCVECGLSAVWSACTWLLITGGFLCYLVSNSAEGMPITHCSKWRHRLLSFVYTINLFIKGQLKTFKFFSIFLYKSVIFISFVRIYGYSLNTLFKLEIFSQYVIPLPQKECGNTHSHQQYNRTCFPQISLVLVTIIFLKI